MVINAMILGISAIHVRWRNKRYELSRWLFFVAMIGFASQFFVQMKYGFRATSTELGALVNTLFYTPCFTLTALGIYNIEAPHAHFKQMYIVCGSIYAATIGAFVSGYCNTGSMYIGWWLYVMLFLHLANVVYCIIKIGIAMKRHRIMLETMTASDMLPFMRYAHTCVAMLLISIFTVPFAIIHTPLTCIVAPLVLTSLYFASPSWHLAIVTCLQTNCLT